MSVIVPVIMALLMLVVVVLIKDDKLAVAAHLSRLPSIPDDFQPSKASPAQVQDLFLKRWLIDTLSTCTMHVELCQNGRIYKLATQVTLHERSGLDLLQPHLDRACSPHVADAPTSDGRCQGLA